MKYIPASIVVLIILAANPAWLWGQNELLPLRHPATQTLVRIYEYGSIPEFPREHLPISRGAALRFLHQAIADTLLPATLRQQAEYYRYEIAADGGTPERSAVIPTRDNSRLWFTDLFANRPLAILDYRDSGTSTSIVFEPLLDAEYRIDAERSVSAIIAQGGAVLRGSIMHNIGFSARITNGTVTGDSSVALSDPRFGRSLKFGLLGSGRDADFASAHVRADFDNVAVEIGREDVQLGGGMERSMLLGSMLPSNMDYIRLTANIGKFRFSHIHASVLAEPTGVAVGSIAEIPTKYVATHLVTVGPFGGIRGSLGEAVVYSGRPFEIGYLNPFNFMKSQEHYLRDRDNSYMYGALSANPVKGLFLEGEFMLDDLRFSEIGNGYWGNKTAWRIGGKLVALPISTLDVGVTYTRLEPYVYSHFNPTDAYTHDGTTLAAGGLEPNSYLIATDISYIPLPNLRVTARIATGEHGANVIQGDTIAVNVGGDIRYTFNENTSTNPVNFLDGVLQERLDLQLDIEYEILRNIYIRARGYRNSTKSLGTELIDSQLWLGIRLGAH